MDLRPEPAEVPSARSSTRRTLSRWGLASVANDCETIVSELVTNAISATAAIAGSGSRSTVQLRIIARPGELFVEVWDASEEMPHIGLADQDSLSGRGLFIVAALAARTGAYRTQGGGKCTWAVITYDTETWAHVP
jgi:anti-sigma regulatory factor (Ser/Thr protein kinase)